MTALFIIAICVTAMGVLMCISVAASIIVTQHKLRQTKDEWERKLP